MAAKKQEKFTFVGADGETYELPPATTAKLKGREVRDASLGGDAGMLAFMFKKLEATKATREALDALYDLPEDKMLKILKAWGDYGDGEGTSLGE